MFFVKRPLFQALLLALLSTWLYLPSLSFHFTNDDALVTTGNTLVQSREIPWLQIFSGSLYEGTSFAAQNGDLYRPLLKVSLALNHLLSPDFDPFYFHAVNLLLYTLCVIAVYFLFRNLLFQKDPALAFLGALLFAVFPSHLESVCNIKHREEMLALFFALGAWLTLGRTERISLRRSLCASMLFLAALLSKESAILLFPCIALWQILEGRLSRNTIVCFAGAVLLYLGMRTTALGSFAGGGTAFTFFLPGEGIVFRFAVSSLLFFKYYLWDQLFALQLDPSFSDRVHLLQGGQPTALAFVAAGIVLVLVFYCIFEFLKRRSLWSFLALCFFMSSLFVLNLFPIGTAGGFRHMFTPSVFLVALLMLGIKKISEFLPSSRATGLFLWMVCVLLAGRFALATRAVMPAWQNDGALFSYSAQVGATNPRSHYAAGQYFEAHEQEEKKLFHYEKALAILLSSQSESWLLDERSLDMFSVVATEVAYSSLATDPSRALLLADTAIAQFEHLTVLRGGNRDTNETAPYYVKALALEKSGRQEEMIQACMAGLAISEHPGLRKLLLNQTILKKPAP